MIIKRREFLQIGSLATVATLIPRFLQAFENPSARWSPAGNKVVVILQLSGGNDGLNTIIPINNDIYYKSRPVLGIDKSKALKLTDEAGLHPALVNFKTLYDEGNLGILNSVGYPNPDRSHFRSMDIWQSASDSKQYWPSGWIGRYLDAECTGCSRPTQALELDNLLSLALRGENNNGIAFQDIKQLHNNVHEDFINHLNSSTSLVQAHEEIPVDYLYKTMAQTVSCTDYIFENLQQHSTSGMYPNSPLGKYLKTIASLILSDINTKVYYVSLGTFDTHFNQLDRQERLFKQMDDAVAAFVKDLKANNRFGDVLLFTFSEFGRRVSQNASQGTDHGTANSMFFISGGLKQKGLINTLPDLSDLNDGDLKHQVDFKSVYATILNKWLGVDDARILKKQYDYLDFI